jgi:hypothetical protein
MPTRGGRVVTFIVTLTLISQLISLAFGRIDEEQTFSAILIPSLLFLGGITIPLTLVGVHLGRKIGTGAPHIEAWLSGKTLRGGSLKADVAWAVTAGLFLGAALVGLRMITTPYLPETIAEYGFRGVSGSLAVSFGAAVAEEVWFRLGALTLLVWLVTMLSGKEEATRTIFWSVIVVTSVLFGLAHLPQLFSFGAGTTFAIVGTIAGNTAVGVLYGWLFWRRGLFAAICAHFSVDLVIHVIPAFFV